MSSQGPNGASRQRSAAAAPPVEVVVVTHGDEPELGPLLTSVAEQGYPGIQLTVITDRRSAGLDDQLGNVPGAEPVVVEVEPGSGFGPAANVLLEADRHPIPAPFYLLCHDDVVLAPDTVRLLVEEALRSNAGILGPKLVEYDQPERLLQVGLGVDKLATPVPKVEPGELDQEQHDAVGDVFAVPGACQLIRADLFVALGGFDPEMDLVGEDVDLCWRAHVAGARVVIVPSAVVRHREGLAVGRDPVEVARLEKRHQLRTVLSGYGRWNSIRVTPQAALATIVEIVAGLLTGRFGVARAAAGSWGWNLARTRGLMRRRRALAKVRQLGDKELRALQEPGFAPLAAFFRNHAPDAAAAEAGDASAPTGALGRGLMATLRSPAARAGWVLAASVLVVIAFGSRHLLTRGIPVIGDLAPLDSGPADLLAGGTSGWLSGGLGREGPTPPVSGMMTVAGVAGLGQMGLVRTLLIVGMIPLGAFGMWRLLRSFESTATRVVGVVAYIAAPLAYNSLANGNLAGLVAFAASPWLVAVLGRAGGALSGGRPRSPLGHGLVLGIIVALAVALAPGAMLLLFVVAAAVLVGSILALVPVRTVHVVVATLTAAAVAFLLLLPWTLDALLEGRSWGLLLGTAQPRTGEVALDELLRLRTAGFPGGWLQWALPLAGLLALVLGRAERWGWAVRGWSLYMLSVATAWASTQSWFPFEAPRPEMLLAPAATGLAIAVAMGVAAFQRDLRAYRFGWRQVVPFTAAAALVLAVVPLLGASFDGRWTTPKNSHLDLLERIVADDEPAGARVLWLGHDDVVTPMGLTQGDDSTIAITGSAELAFADPLVVLDDGTELVREAIDFAAAGGTRRLGRLLGPFGIRYLVLVERLSPAPAERLVHPIEPALAEAVAEQLDLAEVVRLPGFSVYENEAWIPVGATIPAGSLGGDAPSDALAGSPVTAQALLPPDDAAPVYSGVVGPDEDVWLGVPIGTEWRITVDGEPQPRTGAQGWATSVRSGADGEVRATHDAGWVPGVLLVGQFLVWVVAIGAALWRPSVETDPASAPPDGGSGT